MKDRIHYIKSKVNKIKNKAQVSLKMKINEIHIQINLIDKVLQKDLMWPLIMIQIKMILKVIQ